MKYNRLRCFNFEICSILLPHDIVENLLLVMCDMNNDVVIYQSADGLVKMEAIVDASNETIWATQKAMASLLGVDRTVITRHLSNIFKEGELDKEVVCAKIAQTTPHGAMEGEFQTRDVQFYPLGIELIRFKQQPSGSGRPRS